MSRTPDAAPADPLLERQLRETQVQLQQARAAAEAAKRAQAEFLSNLNHEIRTPMNAILGMTELALEGELAPRERNFVGKVRAAAQGLSGTLSDLLDFAEIESGDFELTTADFAPADLLDSVANAVGAMAREKGLDLLLHLDPDVHAVLRGDALRLNQVLVKLAGNAIKFTERGGIVIAVEHRAASQGRLLVRFSVTDTGIGLPEGAQAWLFDESRQTDDEPTRRPGGIGLGLAVCRGLVRRMNGRIWAEQAPGGTVFQFDVPLLPGRKIQSPRRPGFNCASRRVLVVDDSDAFSALVAAYIGSLGPKVETAGDAETALERLRAADRSGKPFDLLVADWHLPVMDGIEMARHAQSGELRHRPATVLVTGSNAGEAAQEAKRKGIDCLAILEKPLKLQQVRDALAPHVDGLSRAAGDPPPRQPEIPEGARVLLVDDHPGNRELLMELLMRARIEVRTAANGQEALALLRQEPGIDIVLMDCRMPVMDGYSATEEIRRNPEWRDLPVIALTANAMPEDRARAFRSGMNDHVSKPVNSEVLLGTIANWLDRARRKLGPRD